MQQVYKIKKALKTPWILAVIISIPVFIDVLYKGYETKILIMAALLILLFYLFTINNLIKRIAIDTKEITIRSLFGSNRILVDDIKFIDSITIGSRQFITISAKKSSLIPNTFDDFTGIIDSLCSVAKEEAIGKGLLELREHIVTRKSDITMAWITVILLVLIILFQLFPKIVSM
jgi:hypothetical protein